MTNKKKFLKILVSATSIILTILILANSKTISHSVIKGIHLCLNTLIPSIFIFLIFSNFCQETNVLKFILKPLEPIFQKLFKINKNLTSTIFFSLICGYPTGAYLISNLLETQQISKKTATRLMCFCVNAGPAFLIGAISVPFTGNINLGLILFISQTIAFFIIGMLCSINVKPEKQEKLNYDNKFLKSKNKKSVSQIFINSINRAIKTMAIICGFAILFSAIIGFLFQITNFNFQHNRIAKALISGFFEVTNGITVFNKIDNLQSLLAITLISAFGGICVHCQLKAILAKFKISFKKFYAWRVLYCLISVISCYLFFKFFKTTLACTTTLTNTQIKPGISTKNIVPSISLIILSIALLYCDKKNIIIKKMNKNEMDAHF